jgi:hypothetical protein
MTNSNLIDDKTIDSCMSIINSETKALKKKPGKASVATMAIDIKRDDMAIARLESATPASELEELFKSIC